jgi:hypothetical protein
VETKISKPRRGTRRAVVPPGSANGRTLTECAQKLAAEPSVVGGGHGRSAVPSGALEALPASQ